MKNTLQINAAIDHPDLLEHRVEKLASDQYDLGYGRQRVPANYAAIETSSREVFASGVVAIDNSHERINTPFITNFVFTCIKESNKTYKLTWATILS